MNPTVPQSSDSPAERARREALLSEPRKEYVYNRDEHNIVFPIAIAKTVPPGQTALDHRKWLLLVAGQLLHLLDNLLGIVTSGGRTRSLLSQTDIDELRHHRNNLAMLLGRGVEGTGWFTKLKLVLLGLLLKLFSRLRKALFKRVSSILNKFLSLVAREKGLAGRATSLEEFANQFREVDVPPGAEFFRPSGAGSIGDDTLFGQLRVAGPNPMMIRRYAQLDDRIAITNEQYQAVMGANDTLTEAAADGRLYIADYAPLASVSNGTTGGHEKFLTAPIGLFAVAKGDGSSRPLTPLAIRTDQKPGRPSKVFTPADGTDWLLAKAVLEVADTNYHEVVIHLGLTHLVLEAFAMATPRQLDSEHPIGILLTPHYRGTLAINDLAVAKLINDGGAVDQLLAGTIGDLRALSATSVLAFDFNAMMLENELRSRGVEDESKLPYYPFRDDARLVWKAIHGWVESYIGLYYETDAQVAGDYELQAWLQELTDEDRGHLNPDGIGEGGEMAFRTRSYLIDAVTMTIFTASAQHAAVNYPQASTMSYTPAMPLASYHEAPTEASASGTQEQAYLAYMPPLNMSFLGLNVLQLLGSVYDSRLGDYRADTFSDSRVRPLLRAFQKALEEVETEIKRRNQSRPEYSFLLPSKIPQSINI